MWDLIVVEKKQHPPDFSFIFGRMIYREITEIYFNQWSWPEVLAVSTRKGTGTGISEFTLFIYQKIKKNMIWHMYLCEFIYIYICTKKVRSVSTRECRDKCELAVHGSNHNVSVVWQTYICEYTSVFKEPQSVSARMGTDGCEFAQHGFVYNVSMIDTTSTAQDGGGNFQNRTPIVVSFSLTLMQFHLLIWHVVCITMYYVPSGGWRPDQEPSAEKEPRNPRGMQRESFQSPPVAGRCPSLLGEQKP